MPSALHEATRLTIICPTATLTSCPTPSPCSQGSCYWTLLPRATPRGLDCCLLLPTKALHADATIAEPLLTHHVPSAPHPDLSISSRQWGPRPGSQTSPVGGLGFSSSERHSLRGPEPPTWPHRPPRHLLLGVGEGERPWRGLVRPLPSCWVLIAHRLLGEEGLGDRGGELEGAGLGQLGGPRSLCVGSFVNLSREASP